LSLNTVDPFDGGQVFKTARFTPLHSIHRAMPRRAARGLP
jgi:hypothetical protein